MKKEMYFVDINGFVINNNDILRLYKRYIQLNDNFNKHQPDRKKWKRITKTQIKKFGGLDLREFANFTDRIRNIYDKNSMSFSREWIRFWYDLKY